MILGFGPFYNYDYLMDEQAYGRTDKMSDRFTSSKATLFPDPLILQTTVHLFYFNLRS